MQPVCSAQRRVISIDRENGGKSFIAQDVSLVFARAQSLSARVRPCPALSGSVRLLAFKPKRRTVRIWDGVDRNWHRQMSIP
jgi:hypothetical protein